MDCPSETWRKLTESETPAHVASYDCPPIMEMMSTMCVSVSSAMMLIERFAGSHSLTYAASLAAVLCDYVKNHREKGCKVLGEFYSRFRFRHHPGTMTGLLSTTAYCLAVSRMDAQTQEFVIRLCEGALETCELDLASGRESRAASTLESVEVLCDPEDRPKLFEYLAPRIARVRKMLSRMGLPENP